MLSIKAYKCLAKKLPFLQVNLSQLETPSQLS